MDFPRWHLSVLLLSGDRLEEDDQPFLAPRAATLKTDTPAKVALFGAW
jgi:hypothetical protein